MPAEVPLESLTQVRPSQAWMRGLAAWWNRKTIAWKTGLSLFSLQIIVIVLIGIYFIPTIGDSNRSLMLERIAAASATLATTLPMELAVIRPDEGRSVDQIVERWISGQFADISDSAKAKPIIRLGFIETDEPSDPVGTSDPADAVSEGGRATEALNINELNVALNYAVVEVDRWIVGQEHATPETASPNRVAEVIHSQDHPGLRRGTSQSSVLTADNWRVVRVADRREFSHLDIESARGRVVSAVIMVEVSRDKFESVIRQWKVWTSVGLFLAIIGWITINHMILSRMVFRPIHHLAKTMRRAEPKSLANLRIDVTTNDEIGELQTAFNQFAETIGDKQRLLAATNQNLERSNKDLKDFAYSVSHDLQTPMRNAAFILEVELPEALAEGRYDAAEKLARQAKGRCQSNIRMIREILEWSRVGRIEMATERIDLNQLVAEIRSTYQQQIEAYGGELIVHPLPVVAWRRTELFRALANLVLNGMKYNQQTRRTIEIGLQERGQVRWLYVRDNGVGLREALIGQLFRPFKRLHDPTQFGEGTGMGLAIVKRVVDSYNGTIEVESVERVGTTFWLTLPGDRPSHQGSAS